MISYHIKHKIMHMLSYYDTTLLDDVVTVILIIFTSFSTLISLHGNKYHDTKNMWSAKRNVDRKLESKW